MDRRYYNLLLMYFPASENEYLALTRMISGGFVSVMSVCLIAPIIEEMLFKLDNNIQPTCLRGASFVFK